MNRLDAAPAALREQAAMKSREHPQAPLDWNRDGLTWPNRDNSRFIFAGGIRWHVQSMAPDNDANCDTPVVLLLHGTGASTHSWRGLLPLLAADYRVVAIDFPGHAFTSVPPQSAYSLPGMSAAIGHLLTELGINPMVIVGHSAGSAVACRLALDSHCAPSRIISFNGALLPFGGPAASLFTPLAQILAATEVIPRWFSVRAARPEVMRRLLANTGSQLDAEGTALYLKLAGSPEHVASAFRMMGSWDLVGLQRRWAELAPSLTLVVGERDISVPPSQSRQVAKQLPQSELVVMPGLGHLAHEEDPEAAAKLVRERICSATPRVAPATRGEA